MCLRKGISRCANGLTELTVNKVPKMLVSVDAYRQHKICYLMEFNLILSNKRIGNHAKPIYFT